VCPIPCVIATAATLKGFGLTLALRAAKAIAPQVDTVCPTAKLFIAAFIHSYLCHGAPHTWDSPTPVYPAATAQRCDHNFHSV